MKIWKFRSKLNPNQAFLIQESNDEKSYKVWKDEFQGGYAHDIDWVPIPTLFNNVQSQWQDFPTVFDYIVSVYGEIIEIETDL